MTQHRRQEDINKNIAVGAAEDYGAQGIKTDLIAESTAATGVTIDGVLLKDNAVTASSGITANVTGNITGNITGNVTGNVTGNLDGGVTLDSLVLDVGLVNSAGNNIANATAITKPFTVVAAGNNVVGSILPAVAAGKVIIVKNSSANGALIYPQVNSAINALGANNTIEMAATTAALFIGYNSTLWYTAPLLPS
jgi:hypothetical protein